ncbi:MAG: hypothetical protein ACUZ8I_18230 [Candidatus Scalindua sp.]
MLRVMTSTMLAFFLGAFLLGINVCAERSVEWPGFPEGAVTESTWPAFNVLAIIEGQIKDLDLEKMIITLEGSEKLGNKPLVLTEETACYIGDKLTNIASVRGGTKFQKDKVISFEHLKAGDYIKCNYSIKDGMPTAVRIILISQIPKME